jgi:hypothetical protein
MGVALNIIQVLPSLIKDRSLYRGVCYFDPIRGHIYYQAIFAEGHDSIRSYGFGLWGAFSKLPISLDLGKQLANFFIKQQGLSLDQSTRCARKLELMDAVMRCQPVGKLMAVAPSKATGRLPFAHETILGLHLLLQVFGLGDFSMEEALFETQLYCDLPDKMQTSACPTG